MMRNEIEELMADLADARILIRNLQGALAETKKTCYWKPFESDPVWWSTTCGRNTKRVPYGDFCPHCGCLRIGEWNEQFYTSAEEDHEQRS